MSCPVCHDVRTPRRLFEAHDSALVRCRACALVRVDPYPSAEEAIAQYDAGYFEDAERGYVDYVADEAVFRAEFRRRLRTIQSAGGHGALLDVGCASGALLSEAAALGFEASGIEPDETIARRAQERSGCPVRAGAIEDALLEAARYDVVTLFDVLEHVVDPLAVLAKLRVALHPGGMLAVTVPDFGGLWARVTGKRWPFVTPWEHLLYFTRRTLRRSLHEAGYERIRFHTARTPLSLGTAAAKGPVPANLVPKALHHRGIGLPAGTLFALATSPPLSEADMS